jgi:hypothetical protein
MKSKNLNLDSPIDLVNINIIKNGLTALHYSIIENKEKIVDFLCTQYIEANININSRDNVII